MVRRFSYLAALSVVIGSGAVSGLWTGRWSAMDRLAPRAARLKQIPLTIGDWQGQPSGLDARMVARAELAGYLMRRYENPRGEVVTALLVVGRPGPIAVHTPEVCYGGAGYEPSTPKSKCFIDGNSSTRSEELWLVDLVKQATTAPECLRILYGWTADGSWTASEQPRLDFAGVPALYKLYIVRATPGADGPVQNDPGVQFARQFLSVVRKSVFQTP